MVWRNEISLSDKVKHLILIEAFKNFATNRQWRNGYLIFQTIFIFFLMKRYNVHFFHSERNLPSFRQSLNIIDRGLKIRFLQNLIIRVLRISWPWVLFKSKRLIISGMPLLKIFIESRNLLVRYSEFSVKALLLLKQCSK